MVYEIEFASVISRHHVYKTEWSPKLGERLVCRKDERKEAKEHDEMLLEHSFKRVASWLDMYPLNFPSSCLHFYELMKIIMQVVVEVTGSRKLENGLVIPGTFKAVTRSRRLGAKFYEELNKVKQLCAHMDISIKEMRSKPVRL